MVALTKLCDRAGDEQRARHDSKTTIYVSKRYDSKTTQYVSKRHDSTADE
jgi:hypothetical protein